jgi:hypothetical protein
MGNRQRNFVILNGKKYSADTGKMIAQPHLDKSTASVSDIKKADPVPKISTSPNISNPVKTVASLTPARNIEQFRSAPEKIKQHPTANHTDLRKTKQATDSMSHRADISTTNSRPKSLKVEQPATKIHARTASVDSADRIKQPNLPRVSKLNTPIKKQQPMSQPKMDLGTQQQHARRLRAAQYRKNNQISKFAESRRSSQELAKPSKLQPAAEPKQAVPATKQETVQAKQVVSNVKPVQQFKSQVQPNQKLNTFLANQESSQKTTKTKRKVKKPRQSFSIKRNFIPATAASLSVLLIVGYVTYLNIPNFAMKVAASRAGFDASLPGYTPDGFSFHGPVAYNSGKVVVDFTSNTDDSRYQVAQQESNWDSKSLLENVVKEKTDKYLTFEDRGLTIYVYDGQNATWVNGGVMYTIISESKLNTEQLINIATSI